MRIIAGSLGGRRIDSPRGYKTHPMSEKLRGAIFNKLDDLAGKTVWDAFAGSGALGLEAISRGATSVLATENNRATFTVLKKNIINLQLENMVKASQVNAGTWGKAHPQESFDIILCDPPYNNPQLSTISTLKNHLKPNGLMLLSYSGRDPVPTVNGVVVVDNRNYGDAALAIYRLA